MRLRTLQTFVQVVDSGSFTGAGRALGLTPSVVTRDVAALETHLGTQLLQRTTRQVFVTDEGLAFYGRARRILSEMDSAVEELRPSPERVRGVLRVVMLSIFVPFGILDALRLHLEAHPELSLQIRLSDQAVDLVAGGWDVGIHVGRPPDSTHIAHRLVTLEPALAATPDYLEQRGVPRSPEELIDHNCLRFASDRPQDLWELVGPDGLHQSFPVGGQLEIDNSMALAQAMRAGLGIGLCPRAFLDGTGQVPPLQQVLPGWRFSGFPLYALVPAGRNRVHRVRHFVHWLREFTNGLE